MILRSFGKINIGLRILSKRQDGFHDIETIFYPVKLYDNISIKIEPSEKDHNTVSLHTNKYYIPLSKDNLCYKAVEKFFVGFLIKEHYKISIDVRKKIPVGGGLGGGSSNAAAILKYLINFFKIDIQSNREKILNMALSLGSDVPFFLIMKPCLAEGRGEQLKILNDFKINYDILIVNPNLYVSTKWAYENLNFPADLKKEPILKNISTFKPEQEEIFKNDFEEVVFKKFGQLEDLKHELLQKGAVFSSMSGSGAAMYAFFEKDKRSKLNDIYRTFRKKGFFVHITDSADH